MNNNQLNIKDIFLSAERDFSADTISVRRKYFKVSKLATVLPLLFGAVAFFTVFKFNKSALSEVTFNSLNGFYKMYANEIIAIVQQVSS